jgi:transposase InsO family protein
MTIISEVLEVARSNLYKKIHSQPQEKKKNPTDCQELKAAIRLICAERAGYGYPRVTAILNRNRKIEGVGPVNRKKVYRIMRQENLLLKKFGRKPSRTHDGKVMTLRSNLRFCSDIFQLNCWNGDIVRVAFVMDCCDREIVSFRATTGSLTGETIRRLMLEVKERRFSDLPVTSALPHVVQWLSDNGPQYTARETVSFGRSLGLEICTAPAYCPESNGMAEAFVKRFKFDYAYVNDLPSGKEVISKIKEWMDDYNQNAPHSGLKMASPTEFRRQQQG